MNLSRITVPVGEKLTYEEQRNNFFAAVEQVAGVEWACYSHEVQEEWWLDYYQFHKGVYLENQQDIRQIDRPRLATYLARIAARSVSAESSDI